MKPEKFQEMMTDLELWAVPMAAFLRKWDPLLESSDALDAEQQEIANKRLDELGPVQFGL